MTEKHTMTADEKTRKTLKFLLDNNVDSFIYPDALKKYWSEIGLPEKEQLAILTYLYNDDYIEVFPSGSISNGLFPKQLKISFKGIKYIDDSKLLPAVSRTILGLERKSFYRIVLFAIIGFTAGIFTPILTDVVRKACGVYETDKPIIINLELKDSNKNCISDTTIIVNSYKRSE